MKPDPRENYIAPTVEAYIPYGTHEDKLALTASFWDLFDALYATFLAREECELQQQKDMKYEIEKITENEALRDVLFLLRDNAAHDAFTDNYQALRKRHPVTDHHDPMWMVYLSLSEHAAGAISRDTALNQIIEHAQGVGLIRHTE